MISVFRNASTVSRANVVFPRMEYIKQRMRLNLQNVQAYYRYRRSTVRSNHILVRLLMSVTVPHSMETYRYIDAAKYASFSTGRSMGIGSAIYSSRINRDGHFFGSDVNEIIFLEDIGDPLKTIESTDWRDIEAIKIWTHPRTDLSFTPLVPSMTTDEKGFAVIQIDPSLLFYQFREWKREQLTLPEQDRLTVGHFVATYILPNMLAGYLDVAFANRVFNGFMGGGIKPTRKLAGIALPTMDTYLDQVTAQMVKILSERNYRYDTILKAIPLPFGGKLEDRLILPDMPSTRHAKGLEFACTVKWLQLLRRIELIAPGNANTQFQSETRIVLRRAVTERWLSNFEGDHSELKRAGKWLADHDSRGYVSFESLDAGDELNYMDDVVFDAIVE